VKYLLSAVEPYGSRRRGSASASLVGDSSDVDLIFLYNLALSNQDHLRRPPTADPAAVDSIPELLLKASLRKTFTLIG